MVNKKVSAYHWLVKGVLILLGCTFLSLGSVAQAQTSQTSKANQTRKKVLVQNTKQVGFKDKSAGVGTKSSSMSLNPSLFQKKDPSELMLDSDANLDYRVTQG